MSRYLVVWAFVLVVIFGAGLLLYIRLAPSDPSIWHVDLAGKGFQPPGNAQVFCIRPDNRYGPIQGDPADYLARIDTIALAMPRTVRLAGSVSEGRITWVTRSMLVGFPDYTTAQVLTGPSLCILARQRFGLYDFGTNAARVGVLAQELLGLTEPPSMNGSDRDFLGTD